MIDEGSKIFLLITSVTLGQPSGGASLGENIECRVTVTNDILPGKVDFEKPVIVLKQTDEEIVVPLKRTQYIEGSTFITFSNCFKLIFFFL